MSGAAGLLPVLLAAGAGGLAAVAAREAVLATPVAARWVSGALQPLLRAGREGYAPTALERRRLALIGSGTLLLSGVLIAGPGPAAPLAIAGPAAAGWVVAKRRARYRHAVEREVPGIATAIADALSAGRSVRGALASAAESLDGPPAAEMSRVTADLELGASTAEALAALGHRIGSSRVEGLSAALLSQQLAGGDLASLLRRFAASAAERDRANEDARSATAQARFTGLLVVAMPTGAALFGELVHPGFLTRLLNDPISTALLVAAAILQLGGFALIRRLGQVQEP
jgi:tight adherence protein B